MTACMGGWCTAKRDKCTHYVLPLHPARKNAAERLCGPGMADAFIPIYPTQTPEPAEQKETA